MNSRISNSEEQINDLEERMMEITKSGQQKSQKKNKNKNQKHNLRDLWDRKK